MAIVIEDDSSPKILGGYKLLILVGDCLPADKAPILEAWMKQGGVILATSGAAMFDPYRNPNPAMTALLGLQSRDVQPQTTFFRPRQKLPFLKPLTTVVSGQVNMPVLAVRERIVAVKDAVPVAKFKDDTGPALIARNLGAGKIYYTPTLPGVAYLWSALQPPVVPDRGPATHSIPTKFDPAAQQMISIILDAHAIAAPLRTDPPLVDARILKAPKGYVVPIANYDIKVGQRVTLSLLLDSKVTKATSARLGPLPLQQADGRWQVTLPALGFGDVLRVE